MYAYSRIHTYLKIHRSANGCIWIDTLVQVYSVTSRKAAFNICRASRQNAWCMYARVHVRMYVVRWFIITYYVCMIWVLHKGRIYWICARLDQCVHAKHVGQFRLRSVQHVGPFMSKAYDFLVLSLTYTCKLQTKLVAEIQDNSVWICDHALRTILSVNSTLYV